MQFIHFIYKYTKNAQHVQQKCFINYVSIVQKKVESIDPVLETTGK